MRAEFLACGSCESCEFHEASRPANAASCRKRMIFIYFLQFLLMQSLLDQSFKDTFPIVSDAIYETNTRWHDVEFLGPTRRIAVPIRYLLERDMAPERVRNGASLGLLVMPNWGGNLVCTAHCKSVASEVI